MCEVWSLWTHGVELTFCLFLREIFFFVSENSRRCI
ncbi:unnamed protein product [Brassica napus]|uniref:(rape) hypothetical protein n=1 Tax=Brassica napus TaxID=3708 RepID=A0A816JM12_BRANA|nr:unnamed protein product [Brassica napus]